MESFPIAPAATKAVAFLPVLLAVALIPVLVIVGTSLAGARSARFEISPSGLTLRGDLYGRTLAPQQLRPENARRVDLGASPELTPKRRTLGTGLPGYQAGWFRLANGERALLYLTDRSRAVYVPTTDGYSLLLSPEDPDGFLSALRSIPR